MRGLFGGLLGLGLATAAADDPPAPPSADERAAVAAAQAIPKATTSLDRDLHPAARVVVKLDKATNADLLALAKLPGVGGIEAVDGTGLTVVGLAPLKGLPHLRRLRLYQSGVNDDRLPAVARCKELRELVLGQSKVTAAGVEKLTALTRLEHLDLSDSPGVGDAAMAHLAKLDRLEVLRLSRTKVGDKGLDALKPLEGLRVLDVRKTNVKEKAARAFEDEMPNLAKVER